MQCKIELPWGATVSWPFAHWEHAGDAEIGTFLGSSHGGGLRRTLAVGMPRISVQSISSGKNFRASNPPEKGKLDAIESSPAFWNLWAAAAGDESPRQVSRLCRCHALSLSHGCLHVCDAFRESRPRDARRACGVLMRRCAKTSFPRRRVRSGPFACVHCG